MQQHLGELVFRPALAERHTEMDRELFCASRGGVRHHTDERPGLEVEPGPRPQRAEDRLRRGVDERLHHGIGVDRARGLLHERVAQELAADLSTLSVRFRLGHRILLGMSG